MIVAVIAQLKFVGTYFVPSLYPSLLMVLSAIAGSFTSLAQFSAPPHGSEWTFVLNVIAWLGVATIAATLALTLKKLFGRQPSLTEVLSGLVTLKSLEDFKKEKHIRERGLEEQISKLRHDLDRALTEALQRETVRERTIQEMRDAVSRLHERTETHIRMLDQYDKKIGTLFERIGEAAQLATRAVQAAQDAVDRSNRK